MGLRRPLAVLVESWMSSERHWGRLLNRKSGHTVQDLGLMVRSFDAIFIGGAQFEASKPSRP